MAFTRSPISAVITDAKGNEVNLGQGSGPFTAGPTSIVITDKDGIAVTVGAGGAGTVTSVTASSPLASSGGAAPNISVTGVLPVANGGTGIATPTAYLGGASIINPVYNSIAVENAGSGNIAIFTCPVSSRAICPEVNVHNPTGGSITVFPIVSFDAGVTWYRVGGNAAIGTVAIGAVAFVGTHLDAGAMYGINTTGAGLNIYGTATSYDTASSVKSVYKTSFVSGNNTLYTVPVSKKAIFFGDVSAMYGAFVISNETGSTVTYSYNRVASGGSVASTNQIFAPAGGLATASVSGYANGTRFCTVMSAGDFLNVATNNTGKQLAWIGFSEISA